MTVFAKQIALAQKQIEQFGEKVTYYKGTVDTSSAPTQPWNADDGAPGTFQNVAIVWNYPNFRSARPIMTDATLQGQKGYKLGFIAQQPFTVQESDYIIRQDGSRWIVDDADIVDPDGAVILWEVVFKQ